MRLDIHSIETFSRASCTFSLSIGISNNPAVFESIDSTREQPVKERGRKIRGRMKVS